jgi:hypothetical protein
VVALNSVKGTDPEFEANTEIVTRAGGPAAGWAELRKLGTTLPNLLKHVTWFAEQRVWLKVRQLALKEHEAILQLDYGGFTDSKGKKFSCWSATVLTKGGKQVHIDFFFDASNQKSMSLPTAKKNGKTGIFFLGELLDPKKSPKGDGISLMKTLFPLITDVLFSGDTGNGFRGYEMLDEFSKVFRKFKYRVELANLPPCHAWNLSDGRIAHLNTFFNCLKRVGHVFGAEGAARAFHVASDAKKTTIRKLMLRSHIFFRVVPQTDEDEENEETPQFGAMLQHEDLDKGHVGVQGLLYFNFSFEGPNGTEHPEGYARVREYGDPKKPCNRTHIYTWRKDLAKLMCQTCSNFMVRRRRRRGHFECFWVFLGVFRALLGRLMGQFECLLLFFWGVSGCCWVIFGL